MQQIIKVKTEVRVELLKEFCVSERTLYYALNFETSGYTAESIRRRALELGGVLFQSVETVETKSQFCEGCIVAKYPPCSKLIPCCKCELKQNECNNWQPCPKKEGGAE